MHSVKVIDGVLHYQTEEGGTWIACNPEQLTGMTVGSERENSKL